MAKDSSIKKVLILGSGPIVIGQACEFDYSGTQACKALMQEGIEVVLVNSNPATIMTDPDIATRVYVEPLKPQYIEKVLEREKPDALIPTLGGQTALNLALELDRQGVLKKYGVRMLGASPEVIERAEDRKKFKSILKEIGSKTPKSFLVSQYEEGLEKGIEIGFPIILRPNFTLGGAGGGVAYSLEEYKQMLQIALHESPTSEVLVEQSILGWKEFEIEIIRDKKGAFSIICSIENIDACGVHTGDSITVAPQQTLSPEEYRDMCLESKKIIEAIGLETGGANLQFAVDPQTQERVVIEMNPRVSRSSALASKATGFPIAKITALLAIGYTLEELIEGGYNDNLPYNEILIDYCVTKVPKFNFEKFFGTQDVLTTQMQSVGEVMGIGKTFQESFMKALHSLENANAGFKFVSFTEEKIAYPNSERIHYVAQAFRDGMSLDIIHDLSHIDRWFLSQIQELIEFEKKLSEESLTAEKLLIAKRMGFSDKQISIFQKITESEVRSLRKKESIQPGFYKVSISEASSKQKSYYYSSYNGEGGESAPIEGAIVILGSGANRIGQGIEFDYGCVRGAWAFQKEGFRVVMINSNPETVSTDYDTSDELYFEPLTFEFVNEVFLHVNPKGFVPQWGGQTSLSMTSPLEEEGFPLLGSSLDTIDLAEDRGRFLKVCKDLNLKMPKSEMVDSLEQAIRFAKSIGFPVLCRPSYVLGGRRMEIIESEEELLNYFDKYQDYISSDSPLLIDEFLERALEVDVDLVRSKDWSIIGGIVEHIEAAGIHSGDSMGVLPPQRLKPDTEGKIEQVAADLASRLGVIGHLNLQMAIKNDEIYILEANPRSARSVPFISKSTKVPLVDLSVRAMLDLPLNSSVNWKDEEFVSVKGVVFPFNKLKNSDSILGPEMKSTGESMGRGKSYSEALLKAFISSHINLPKKGEVFLSLRDKDKEQLLPLARKILALGYTISATRGTAEFLGDHDLPSVSVRKVYEGRPNCVDRIRSGKVNMVINTTSGRKAIQDSFSIRRSCIDYSIPCITESDAAEALLLALERSLMGEVEVYAL